MVGLSSRRASAPRVSTPPEGSVAERDGRDRDTTTASEGLPPFRDLVDGDLDRGIAVYDLALRLVYANPAARAVLHDPDGRMGTPLRDALATFRDRLARSDSATPPPELVLGEENGRRVRATIAPLGRSRPSHVVVRFAPTGHFAEPTVRTLQTRFRLTLREAEVALAVAKGSTNGEAAARLGITEKTVKNALMTVFAKCGARNRVELALRAHDAPFPPSL
jgi:DNA-binding CsgD family transcriptional regulator